MAGRVIDVETARPFLDRLQADGFRLKAVGDRLRILPAARVTPGLRDELVRHKAELLILLAPPERFVTLKSGPTLPMEAVRLAIDLEARGYRFSTDSAQSFHIEPTAGLTEADRAAIARWRLHLGVIAAYEAPTCA